MAFEGASWSSEHAFPLMVIQTVLGSWDRSSPSGANVASRWERESVCLLCVKNGVVCVVFLPSG